MDLSSLTPDKQVKLQYWLDVIRQCRASGLTNQLWCEQHDIPLKRKNTSYLSNNCKYDVFYNYVKILNLMTLAK